jgi:hypothetical protein
MAKKKKLSLAIDFGGSSTKAIGIFDGVMIPVIMSPEVVAVKKENLDGLGIASKLQLPRAVVDYAFVGVNGSHYFAVGDLAKQFGVTQRLKPLKSETAVCKVLAVISILADRFKLGNNFDLLIGCLLPPGEFSDRERLKQELVIALPSFDSPVGELKVGLVNSCFYAEGMGILQLYQDRYPQNSKAVMGLVMAGHRNLSFYTTKNGVISNFASCDLGFHDWATRVLKQTSGYKIEELTSAIAKYWVDRDISALQPILRRRNEESAQNELDHLITVLASTNEIYCGAIFDWLDEQLPSNLEEVMISGGAADVLRDELVSYFDTKLPPRIDLDDRAAIYYSSSGFNLPKFDVSEEYQSRMGDVYCLSKYLMPQPKPKTTIETK